METKPKNPGGRPKLSDDEKLVQRSIRMAAAHWSKIDDSGGMDWLRKVVDETKVPKLPPKPKD